MALTPVITHLNMLLSFTLTVKVKKRMILSFKKRCEISLIVKKNYFFSKSAISLGLLRYFPHVFFSAHNMLIMLTFLNEDLPYSGNLKVIQD